MKLGLIARADNSGLGAQTWEFHRHLNPAKTLVIDLSALADNDDHCNKHIFPERFPGAIIHRGMAPPPDVIDEFLDGLDVLFTAETFYCHDMLFRATHRKVKTILQYNYEFLPHLTDTQTPRPTLFAAPSLWQYFGTSLTNKVHLPVPIATDRFTPNPTPPEVAKVWLHPVGRPAVHDRNGTEDVIEALALVRSEITMIFRCQRPGYVQWLLRSKDIPPNVTVVVDNSAPDNYWDNYQGIDAVVLPRRYGGLCLPANESLGTHVPVLMPNIDPNNRYLPQDWLFLGKLSSEFQACNPVQVYRSPPTNLAIHIDKYASEPDTYAKGVRQAQLLAEAYSWDRLLPQYHRTLDRVMDMP